MKGKGTPTARRIPFLGFSALSGRTIFELRTFRIEYVDSICPQCLLATGQRCHMLARAKIRKKCGKTRTNKGVFHKKLFYPLSFADIRRNAYIFATKILNQEKNINRKKQRRKIVKNYYCPLKIRKRFQKHRFLGQPLTSVQRRLV